jgi:hypothetical protein
MAAVEIERGGGVVAEGAETEAREVAGRHGLPLADSVARPHPPDRHPRA